MSAQFSTRRQPHQKSEEQWKVRKELTPDLRGLLGIPTPREDVVTLGEVRRDNHEIDNAEGINTELWEGPVRNEATQARVQLRELSQIAAELATGLVVGMVVVDKGGVKVLASTDNTTVNVVNPRLATIVGNVLSTPEHRATGLRDVRHKSGTTLRNDRLKNIIEVQELTL